MKKKIQTIFLLLLLFLVGCKSSESQDLRLTEDFESALETAIVETIAASLPAKENPTEEVAPTPEDPSVGVSPTQQPSATLELPPTQTPFLVTPTATDLPTPCYRAELVEETIPDGTKFPPGKWFGKVWIVRNTGVCEWTDKFRWVLVEGEDFSGVTDVPLNEFVQPGEEIRILLELKAPLNAGAYKGTYQILTEDGASVTPLGFWVTIVVD